MLHSILFSPSGTTGKIVRMMTDSLGLESNTYDLTVTACGETDMESGDDIILMAAPVYAGRIPQLAAERFRSIKGRGQKAIVIVVYGNRDYDDALAELCDIAVRQGFNVIAAGAFIAQHCIFPKVAANRPDKDDEIRIAEFIRLVRQAIKTDSTLDIHSIKGKRPYKAAAHIPLHPSVDKDKCNNCGTCATQCPVQAIDTHNPQTTDKSKCITCCRCINICPQQARRFDGALYKLAQWKFVKDNTRRIEPEWFV